MSLLNQLSQITKNLAGLGQTKLLALVGVGALSILLIIGSAIFLNKPTRETLYIGLSGEDINQISLVLAEANIDFATGTDGSSVTVPAGMTSRARALLAERGLPSSNSAGYELFDNVGSLGLTSFMQEVTRVRALEGEIARTIQSINGISAARVHIVMPDRGNFRRGDQKPSASVMVRGGSLAGRAADSIRHLVASSVPGLTVDEVTVLDATGKLLAAGDDFSNSNLNRSLSIVQMVQTEVETNIEKALSPFLGIENFRASVNAKVNTDSQQIQETVYDPESRVERSIRVTRENQTSSESTAGTPATVEQNIPDQGPDANGAAGPKSSELAERKEEQTNFEINSKTVSTVRNSYNVEGLSIAVVVNKARIDAMLGGEATPEQTAAYLAELEQVVASASGIDAERGDRATVTVMEFLASEILTADAAQPGLLDTVKTQLGTIINALAFITVAVLLIMFGFRPLMRSTAAASGQDELGLDDELELPDFSPGAMGGGGNSMAMEGFGADFGFGEESESDMDVEDTGSFNRRVKEGPERRLARMVEINEERAAKILRSWASSEAA